MKNLLIIIGAILGLNASLKAQDNFVESKITDVTVYPKGAYITRVIDTKGMTGKIDLWLKDLSGSIDLKSVTIEAEDMVEIISITPKQDRFITEFKLTPEIDSIGKAKNLYQDSINTTSKMIEILKKEMKMIEAHNDLSDNDGDTDIDQLIKASEFYRVRIKEIELEIMQLGKKVLHFQKEFNVAKNAFDEFRENYSCISTRINAKVIFNSPGDELIKIKYFTPLATWIPYYDIKTKDITEDISLYRKAYVSQNTGSDWNNVKLTLSNANPLENNQAPIMHLYDILGHRYSHDQHNSADLYGVILDETNQPFIGANVVIKGTTIGTVTDIDGSFRIKNPTSRTVDISYLGYKTKTMYLNPGENIIRLEEHDEILSDVVIVGYRNESISQLSGSTNGVRVKKEAVRQAINQTKVEAVSSVEFVIDMPFTIPSNREKIDVLLEKSQIPTIYEYFTAPCKIEKAYLIAKIPDWHTLDLLSGKANLFLSNSYKGTSYINPKSTKDTLSISLGVDPEIIVERKQVMDLYSKKFFGKNAEENLSYDLIVKNNKSKAIVIRVMDQIPVSFHKDVKIELEEKTAATYDEEKGFLTWEKAISPGENEAYRFSYKIRYPKTLYVEL